MHTEDLPAGLANRPSATKTSPDTPASTAERSVEGDRPARGDRPRLELTASQILAGVAASVTAAILGSRLGVAGTVLGAALASGVSIAAGAIYTHSIKATRHQVRRVVDRWRPDGAFVGGSGSPLGNRSAAVTPEPRPVGRPRRSAPTRTSGPVRRPWWSGLAVGVVATALVFGVALALVTGIELVKGSPLSGGAAGGLTVLGGGRGSDPDPGSPATSPATAASSTGETSTRATDLSDGTEAGTTSAEAPASESQAATTASTTSPTAASSAPAAASGTAVRSDETTTTPSPTGTDAASSETDAPGTDSSTGAAAGGTRASAPATTSASSAGSTPSGPGTTSSVHAGTVSDDGTDASAGGPSAG